MNALETHRQRRALLREAVSRRGLAGWWIRLRFVWCSPFELIGLLKYNERLTLRIGRRRSVDLWNIYRSRGLA